MALIPEELHFEHQPEPPSPAKPPPAGNTNVPGTIYSALCILLA